MKLLHSGFAALGAAFLSLSIPQSVEAQVQTSRPAPVIDGISSFAEYGNEYISSNDSDPNLKWRMTWDDTNLYIAIEDANLQEGAALYLDVDPQVPVKPTGNIVGFNNYLSTNGKLPIEADIVIYAEKFYHEFRRYNRENNTWGAPTEWGKTGPDGNSITGLGQYADNATGEETGNENCKSTVTDDVNWSECRPETNFSGTVKEFSLPWSEIGVLSDPSNPNSVRRRPENFNWLGQIHFAADPTSRDDPETPEREPDIPNDIAGGIYGQVPRDNEFSARNNNIPEKGLQYKDYNWTYYFTVLNTSAGSDNTAFGPPLGIDNSPLPSYSHTGDSETRFPFFRAYDFTVNNPGVNIIRTEVASPNSADWDILGSIVVGPSSSLNLSASAAPVNISRNLNIAEGGFFSFRNEAGLLSIGGDVAFSSPASFDATSRVSLTGNGPQSIGGDTYRALTIQGTGVKTITNNDLFITESLLINNGTLVTGSNTVELGTTGQLSETNNGYLLGRVAAQARTPLSSVGSSSDFGGIGLTLTQLQPQSSGNFVNNVSALRVTGTPGTLAGRTDAVRTISRRFSINANLGNNPGPQLYNVAAEFGYRTANPDELGGNNPTLLELYKSESASNFSGTYSEVDGVSYTRTTPNVLGAAGLLELNGVFYSLADGVTPLPVELTSFTGKAENNAVRLNWVTASELRNKGFEIERRTDQGDWKKLGFVAGNGTTSQRHAYTYVDRAAVTGNNYYRLRQIDTDGKSVYSPAVTVVLGNVPFSLSPVPATDVLTINGLSAGKHVAEIYNSRGQRVLTKVFSDASVKTVSVSALPVGVYMVRVLGPGQSTRNARFIKQ